MSANGNNPFAAFNEPPAPVGFVPPPLQIPPLENFIFENDESVHSEETETNENRGNGRNSNSALSAYNVNGPETKNTDELLEIIQRIAEERNSSTTRNFYMGYGNMENNDRIAGYNAHKKHSDEQFDRLKQILKNRGVYVDSEGYQVTKEEAERSNAERTRLRAIATNAASTNSGFPMNELAQNYPPTPEAASASASAAPWAPARRGLPALHLLNGRVEGNSFAARLAAANSPPRRGTKRNRGNGNGNGAEAKRRRKNGNGYNANSEPNLEGGRRKHRHTKKCKCRKAQRTRKAQRKRKTHRKH